MTPKPADIPASRPAHDAFWLARLESEGVNALIAGTPTPSPSFSQCLQQLNDGLYFEAHESLEAIWLEAPYPMKLFYYALIKTAVGLLQIERHNATAAKTQLTAALRPPCAVDTNVHGSTDKLAQPAAQRQVGFALARQRCELANDGSPSKSVVHNAVGVVHKMKEGPDHGAFFYIRQADAGRLSQCEYARLLEPSASLELLLIDGEQRLAQIRTASSGERRRYHRFANGYHPCTWDTP